MKPSQQRPRMRSYGVPDEVAGTLPWDWAAHRLVASRNYWLTTVDRSGRPHSTPVWGVWVDDDHTFWFASAPDSLKVRNIAANPHVVVAADSTVEVVSVEGKARPAGERPDIAHFFGEKYGESSADRDRITEFFATSAMYQVVPVRAFGIIEREEEFSGSATRWVF